MNIKAFLQDWITISNSFNSKKYLEFYLTDALLDDPSVGKKFMGKMAFKYTFLSLNIQKL